MATTRRDFLKSMIGPAAAVSLAPSLPPFLVRSASAAGAKRDQRDTVLVVVQLAGGNDGLNTVVPYAADEYARNRTTLRLTVGQVLKIDDQLGFHAAMPGFSRLLKEGRLSVVQGIGYPNPDYGHPGSMRIWQTAMPDRRPCQTGWLGRAVDSVYRSEEGSVPAVFVGQIRRPLALNAEKAIVPAVRSIDECSVRAAKGPGARWLEEAASARGDENPLLSLAQKTTQAAYLGSRQIDDVLAGARASRAAQYPSLPLARTLATIAQLIRANLGVRVYFTELGGSEPGGFDNHANQRDNHATLLGELSQSVTAFVDDLACDRLLDRVVLMTFSEFGRTLAENGRRGTGHGAAQPIFLAGGKLRGGLVGKHPNLSDLDHEGGLKHHTDFRRLYATALDRWLGFDSVSALGGRFETLEVLDG